MSQIFYGRYVCSCMKVSMADIKTAVDGGASSFQAIHLATRCGGKCGGCIETVKAAVDGYLAESQKLTALPPVSEITT